MSSNSNIEWTQATWNPVAGCTPVSPGCLHCYAATMAHRLDKMGQEKYRGLTVLHNGIRTFNGKINLAPDQLEIPLRRRKPTVWFVNSMSDLFHEDVPFEYVDRVFAAMALTPHHTYQILTKRPERMAEYMNRQCDRKRWPAMDYAAIMAATGRWNTPALDLRSGWPLPNVWLGCSPCNQKTADEYVPKLLSCPAAIHFLSCEPLLGPIDLCSAVIKRGIHDPQPAWVIVGGESGPGARRCELEWVRAIVAQCRAAGVPCFVKQLGSYVSWNGMQGGYLDGPSNVWPSSDGTFPDAATGYFRKYLIDKKGGNPDEWPEDLRVRQMPSTYEEGARET